MTDRRSFLLSSVVATLASTLPATPLKAKAASTAPLTLLGPWTFRVAAQEGMTEIGPNSFFPETWETGWATTITAHPDGTGTATVNFRNWTLHGSLANRDTVFFGTWHDDEPQTGYAGAFCLMVVPDPDSPGGGIIIGASHNQTGAWQAIWGRKLPSQV